MKIKAILSQSRRDFKAVYVCEHCESEEIDYGYDDSHFHKNVIPNMVCKVCGEKSKKDYQPRPTKYTEGFQI